MMAALVVSLGLNLVFVGKSLYRTHVLATRPTKDLRTEQADRFLELPPPPGSVVIIGDSHVDRFPVRELFPGLPLYNRGIGGLQAAQLLPHVTAWVGPGPRTIVVMIGVNDVIQGVPPDQYLTTMERMIDTLQATFPGTPIVVNELLPNADPLLDDRTRAFNTRLRDFCERGGCSFVPLYDSFVEGGVLSHRLTYDGLHLNTSGYRRWADTLRPHLP